MSDIKIIFIRHGEAANAWGTHEDPCLSEIGLSQATNLIKHEKLLDLNDYLFISSPKLRAKETAYPLAKKFKKEIIIDETFIEIPSKNISLDQKDAWLKEIVASKKDLLPEYIKSWSEEIFYKLMDIKNHSVIFTHFMVMNSVVSRITGSETLLSFYPDYTSILELVINNRKIKSYSVGESKKTYINL